MYEADQKRHSGGFVVFVFSNGLPVYFCSHQANVVDTLPLGIPKGGTPTRVTLIGLIGQMAPGKLVGLLVGVGPVQNSLDAGDAFTMASRVAVTICNVRDILRIQPDSAVTYPAHLCSRQGDFYVVNGDDARLAGLPRGLKTFQLLLHTYCFFTTACIPEPCSEC